MESSSVREIEADEVKRRLENGEALTIIDVREDEEWEAGHIPGATHIQLGSLGHRLDELDSSHELIMVCRSGNRSGYATEQLEAIGFQPVNMLGGMLAWKGQVIYEDR